MQLNIPTKHIESAIEWAFDFDIFFSFEIPTAILKPILPKLIHPQEVRPGVSLIALGLHRFLAGNLDGSLPAFVEANCSILVQPQLSLGAPPPRFAYYVLYVASSCEGFTKHAAEKDKMPVYQASNLQCTIAPDGERVDVWDDHGPMFTLQNTKPNRTYLHADFFGQIFSFNEAKQQLYLSQIRASGQLCEHQHKGRSFGKLYNHPSLRGLQINEHDQNCYLQMITKIGEKGLLTYGKPKRVY